MKSAEVLKKLSEIDILINQGNLDTALEYTQYIYDAFIQNEKQQLSSYHKIKLKIACYFVDIANQCGNALATSLGLELMEGNKAEFISLIGEGAYFYNLGNAKSNTINKDSSVDFDSIEFLIEVKNCYWKAVKHLQEADGKLYSQCTVNLAVGLGEQFRLVEALKYYDAVIRSGHDIPESWRNRSYSLGILSGISGSFSIEMFHQIIEGYTIARDSQHTPKSLAVSDNKAIEYWKNKIVEVAGEDSIDQAERHHDKNLTEEEYNQQSSFRKFCLERHLVLSEHGLYCGCIGSTHDDLSVARQSEKSGTNYSRIEYEIILNRIKSEFFFARQLYYECLVNGTPNELTSEESFTLSSELEIWGIRAEKLKTCFKTCFSMLDKLALGICKMYPNLSTENENIYFQNFWRMSQIDRREEFESIGTYGLLALYSIATDLNFYKNGEFSFFKNWRNDLEHRFFVLQKSSHKPPNPLSEQGINEEQFIANLETLLQLTRSAIFSFAFLAREKNQVETEMVEHLYKNSKI